MISQEQFDMQMNRLRDVWPRSYDNSTQIELIWNICQPLEFGEFVEIITHMLASMRKPPLPIDFGEAAKSRRRYTSGEPEIRGMRCAACEDLGVLRFQSLDFDALVLCSCSAGKEQLWRLPMVSANMKREGTVTKCPVEWFKPTGGWDPKGGFENGKDWGTRVRKSIKDWEEHGLIE